MIPFYRGDISNFISPELEDIVNTGIVTNWGKYYHLLVEKIEQYLFPRKVALVASGTHALTLSLLSLKNKGILPDKAKILVPSFTFIASVQAIIQAGMTPIFGDINKETWTLDLSSVGWNFDGIMPVNIFGVQPKISEEYITVHDLSHGFGGSLDGSRNGTTGTICAFSTSVTKPFHTIEGGIVSSLDEELIKDIHNMSRWNLTEDYDCLGIGQWSKLSELHALVGLRSLETLDSSIQKKEEIARQYTEELKNLPIIFQKIPEGCLTTRKDFAILVPDGWRKRIINKLKEKDIGYKLYFSPAIHETTYFNKLYPGYVLPVTERVSSQIICLPIHKYLSSDNISYICEAIKECF